FDGETVTLFSSIREQEADQLQDTFDAFTECTGITVQHNGSGEFEQQVVIQAESGNAPDLAIFPQPGLLERMVREGHVVPAPDARGGGGRGARGARRGGGGAGGERGAPPPARPRRGGGAGGPGAPGAAGGGPRGGGGRGEDGGAHGGGAGHFRPPPADGAGEP